MKTFGLDISDWQRGIDFDSIADDNTFVILRIGYGHEHLDPSFNNFYNEAKERGLKVGGYFYSYALNVEEAKIEAEYVNRVIKDKVFDYPIYYDMEDGDQYKAKNGMPSNDTLSSMCDTFCSTLESYGYYVGIYANEDWMKNKIYGVVSTGKYDLWLANFGSNNGLLQSDRSSEYRMHQYTSKFLLNGKYVDRNVCYFDYPRLMKEQGFNGYSKVSNERPPVVEEQKNIDQLANEVIQGLWGNGDDRKNRLTVAGYDYNAVQSKVDKMLSSVKEEVDILDLVRKTIRGDFGSGTARRNALGVNFSEVQRQVELNYMNGTTQWSKIRLY